jgi:hypothetical protein
MSWADLDKIAVKPRPDGGATLVIRDDRPLDKIFETKHLSIIIAIARVTRARHALAEKYGGRGAVVYVVSRRPPDFLLDAITAAGGIAFHGTREHSAASPLPTTLQLDATFSDLGSQVRRRLGAKSFLAALESLEWELRRKLPDRADPAAWWTATVELAALTGECMREKRAARWTEAPSERFPLGLDLGKSNVLLPGQLAQTILEGGAGTMRSLLELTDAASGARGPAMPLLVDRHAVPIDKLTWERVLPEEFDTEHVPVIAYVEDHGGAISWPYGPPTPTPERRARALANLAKERVEIGRVDLGPQTAPVAVVTGNFYAAESLLLPATMERVRAELGRPNLLIVGVPARGYLFAIDGERATLDDNLQLAFLLMIEQAYLEATERDRISTEVLLYTDRPRGRLQSNVMDARRFQRTSGLDPDA